MKLVFAMCLVLFAAWTAEARTSASDWTNLVSEGKALTRGGSYSAAAEAFRQALIAAEGANAGERSLIEIHDALASVYAEAGHYAESEYEYRRTLGLSEKRYGRQSLEYALLVGSLVVLPTQMGDRDSAVAVLRQAITVNARSGATRDLAIIRGCLAHILMDQMKYEEAESVLVDSTSNLTKLKTLDPKVSAELLNDLGLLRFSQRRYGESIEPYLESLELFQEAMGEGSPALLVPFSNLALSYLEMGRFSEAEMILKRAIVVCRGTLGQDHPTCGVLLENYALVLRKLGRKREAKSAAAQSRDVARASRTRNGVGLTVSITALRSECPSEAVRSSGTVGCARPGK